MKTAAIVASYNPFHNGHRYQIQKAKQVTGADFVVVLLCGDFVRQGEPAVCDKLYRIEAALKNGADLVLEMPVSYVLSDADTFAEAAVEILDRLGFVDVLSFGEESEMGDAYLRALQKRGSKIQPMAIPVIGAGYHDMIFTPVTPKSAAIRNVLFGPSYQMQWNTYKNSMPDLMAKTLQSLHDHNSLIERNDFSQILHYQIVTQDEEKLALHPDVSPKLAKAMKKAQFSYTSLTAFADKMKSEAFSEEEINRAFMEIVLNIFEREPITEIRVLGMTKAAAKMMDEFGKRSEVALLTSLAGHREIWQSDHVFDMIQAEKTKTFMHAEQTKQVLYIG